MVKLEARIASHSHPDLYVSNLERGVLIGRNLDEEEESHHADTLPGSIVGHTMTWRIRWNTEDLALSKDEG